MVLREVSQEYVGDLVAQTLGLDPNTVSLSSTETIACALRRAAAFYCPCIERTLIHAVLEPMHGLLREERIHSDIKSTLESLITHGDLLELKNTTHDESDNVLIHIAPPSFVCRQSGTVVILGIGVDGISPLPRHLENAIEYVDHTRVISSDSSSDLNRQLEELGFIEIPLRVWMKAPKKEPAEDYLEDIKNRLAEAPVGGHISGLTLIDPDQPVNFYKQRWEPSKDQTGVFVARRPKAYGADVWCVVDLENGYSKHLIDLPVRDIEMRGCDNAWRIQASIDATRGTPQIFSQHQTSEELCNLEFFSPVPMWAERRWSAVGKKFYPPGCLFSYQFPQNEVQEEIEFIMEHLWLREDS